MGRINKFVNKQMWRIKQTFLVFQPFIIVIQLLLWVVITIGITEWFELTFDAFMWIIFLTFIGMNLIGYVLDKRRFFIEHKTEEFAIAYPEMWTSQVRIDSAMLAKYIRLPDEELNKILVDNMRRLGVSEKIIEDITGKDE